MKKTVMISFILSIITILSALCYAQDSDIIVYNKGSVINLNDSIIYQNEKYYISVNDMSVFNLETYTTDSHILFRRGYETSLEIFLDGNHVYQNRQEIEYSDAVILFDSKYYLSIPLVAQTFSKIYEIDNINNTIKLSINDKNTASISAKLSLPGDSVAPSGGFSFTVYRGYKPNTSSTSGTVRSLCVGFPYGDEKQPIPPSTDIFNLKNVIMTESIQMTIKEGENSVNYSFDYSVFNGSGGSSNITNYIGYIINSGNLMGGDKTKYEVIKYSEDYVINMQLNYFEVKKIAGTVSIPLPAEEDVGFTVYVEGGNDETFSNTAHGVIKAGELSGSYSAIVKPNKEYNARIYFDLGKYKRSEYSEIINVDNSNIADIDFSAVPSVKISGYIRLPDQYTASSDISGRVTIQGTQSYVYLDRKQFTVFNGDNNAYFELYNDLDDEYVIFFYELYGQYEGLYNYGHYNMQGTKSAVMNAETLYQSIQSIDLTILKGFKLSGSFTNYSFQYWLSLSAIAVTDNKGYITNIGNGNVNGSDDHYSIVLPAEYSDYIICLRFQDSIMIYYKDGSFDADFTDAQVTKVIDDIDDFPLTLNKYSPTLPILIENMEMMNSSDYNIRFYNNSDFDFTNIQLKMCFYDKNMRLKNIVSRAFNSYHYQTNSLMLDMKDYYQNSNMVKIYVWSDNLKPLSEVSTIKDTDFTVLNEIKDVVTFTADSTVITVNKKAENIAYSPEIINNTLLVPMRIACEKIGLTVSWNGLDAIIEYEGKSIKLNLDNNGVVIDENTTLQLSTPMKLINNIPYIPLEEIARTFGLCAEYFAYSNTLIINKLFYDVSYDNKYYDAMVFNYKYGLLRGYEDGAFHSEFYITRAETSIVIARILGVENTNYNFQCNDVRSDDWAKSFIGHLVALGIFSLENDCFRPYDYITYKEVLLAFLKINNPDIIIDENNLISVATEIGLLNNINIDNINDSITREELAQITYNLVASDEIMYDSHPMEITNKPNTDVDNQTRNIHNPDIEDIIEIFE